MRALVVHGVHDLRVDDRESPKPGPGEVEVSIAVGGVPEPHALLAALARPRPDGAIPGPDPRNAAWRW